MKIIPALIFILLFIGAMLWGAYMDNPFLMGAAFSQIITVLLVIVLSKASE